MMMSASIANYLAILPLGEKGAPGCLRQLAALVGGSVYHEVKHAARDRVVAALSEHYGAPGRFDQLWTRLSDAERKIVSLHIWGGGDEPAEYADDIAKQFRLVAKKDQTYYRYSLGSLARFMSLYAKDDSPLWQLFPRIDGTGLYPAEVRAAVGELKRVYSDVSDDLVFQTREDRATDFAAIVRCSNLHKLAVTSSGVFSKAAALKLWGFCGYEDYAAEIDLQPAEVRRAYDLLVTFPLTMLCTIGGLVAVTEARCVPGGKAMALLALPHEQLVKRLFDAYLKSKSFDEISVMTGLKAKRGHQPFEARQNLAEELKHCPVGQAVYSFEFAGYLRLTAKAFARRDDGYVVQVGGGHSEYAASWDQYEHPLIQTILSFFAALGLIDIAWDEEWDEYTQKSRRIPEAFRLNPLGAYVLGLSSSYAAPVASKSTPSGGFTVLPDYTIVVPASVDRLRHELYLEKLFTKVSATEEAAIYRLDFETVVRALSSGIDVADLRQYLLASDKPLPDNVLRALDDWERQASRIRLRQVTILECDDAALLEEVIRYRGMGALVKERVQAAVVVDGSATREVKRVIEKNKRFCRDVL